MVYTVAVIGTGPEPENPDRDGYAMAYHHAAGYDTLENCELVACADIVQANAEAFADEFGIDSTGVFESYETMLETVEPDIVSVCVPPASHAPIVVDCARSEVVRAIHCEKPMADTYGAARRMVRVAERNDVQLTFNHQRRFSDAVRTAKELLDDGEIGPLERVEFAAPAGIFDYGSHSFDLCNYFVDGAAAEWVLGQIDYREENVLFGMHNENQALVSWAYETGVHGIAASDSAGIGTGGPTGAVRCHNRLIGREGVIEIEPMAHESMAGTEDESEHGREQTDGLPVLRMRRSGGDWTAIDVANDLHDWELVDRAIADCLRSLETGSEPELGARNALAATELIFGVWASSRRHGRVDFPLEIDGNPLEAMLEAGELTPKPAGSGD